MHIPWLKDHENLLFIILIVVCLIPIWQFKYLPSQDGPSHINNANIIREYHYPDYPVLRRYYTLNKRFTPNLFGHLLMAGLMYIMSPLFAEKILLSIYVILLPISVRYVLRAIRPDSSFLAVLSFPLIYNYLFHMGFYNFSCSLPFFFFVVGYWIKYQEGFNISRIAVLAVLSLLLYSCHILSVIIAYLAIAILAIWLTLLESVKMVRERRRSLKLFWHSIKRRALSPFFAFLPTALVAILFLQKTEIEFSPPEPFPILWKKLYHLLSLVSFRITEVYFSTILAELFIAVAIYLLITKIIRRQFNRWDGLFLVVVSYTIIYFTMPEPGLKNDGMVFYQMLNDRLSLFPFFGLILWFGAQTYHRIVRLGIKFIAVFVAIVLIGLNAGKYGQLNDYIEEYLSATRFVESNTTLLPLCFSPYGRDSKGERLSLRVAPFLHASGHIAAEKGVVDLDNYEATRGYFPTFFRSNLDPFMHIGIDGGLEGVPPRVEFLTYPKRTGGSVDYVLVWQMQDEQLDDKYTKSILTQLQKGYKLIHVSPKRGLARLYGRKM